MNSHKIIDKIFSIHFTNFVHFQLIPRCVYISVAAFWLSQTVSIICCVQPQDRFALNCQLLKGAILKLWIENQNDRQSEKNCWLFGLVWFNLVLFQGVWLKLKRTSGYIVYLPSSACTIQKASILKHLQCKMWKLDKYIYTHNCAANMQRWNYQSQHYLLAFICSIQCEFSWIDVLHCQLAIKTYSIDFCTKLSTIISWKWHACREITGTSHCNWWADFQSHTGVA